MQLQGKVDYRNLPQTWSEKQETSSNRKKHLLMQRLGPLIWEKMLPEASPKLVCLPAKKFASEKARINRIL